MKKIHLEEYRRIQNPKGNIYKFMETCKFPKHLKGEIYMSQIKFNEIKAWRRHKLYEAIFIVVSGIVQLKCMNKEKNLIFKEELSLDSRNLVRLDPYIWYGFKGLSKSENSILVIINGSHNETEIERLNNEDFEEK